MSEKGLFEKLIETSASGVGSSVAWLADHGILFGLFAILWITFAVGLVWSQGTVDQAWEYISGLPLLIQVVVWILFLPVMAGLWIWETTWPLLLRVALVIGIAGWNLLVFLPRALQTARPS
jgi:hypothetical protein